MLMVVLITLHLANGMQPLSPLSSYVSILGSPSISSQESFPVSPIISFDQQETKVLSKKTLQSKIDRCKDPDKLIEILSSIPTTIQWYDFSQHTIINLYLSILDACNRLKSYSILNKLMNMMMQQKNDIGIQFTIELWNKFIYVWFNRNDIQLNTQFFNFLSSMYEDNIQPNRETFNIILIGITTNPKMKDSVWSANYVISDVMESHRVKPNIDSFTIVMGLYCRMNNSIDGTKLLLAAVNQSIPIPLSSPLIQNYKLIFVDASTDEFNNHLKYLVSLIKSNPIENAQAAEIAQLLFSVVMNDVEPDFMTHYYMMCVYGLMHKPTQATMSFLRLLSIKGIKRYNQFMDEFMQNYRLSFEKAGINRYVTIMQHLSGPIHLPSHSQYISKLIFFQFMLYYNVKPNYQIYLEMMRIYQNNANNEDPDTLLNIYKNNGYDEIKYKQLFQERIKIYGFTLNCTAIKQICKQNRVDVSHWYVLDSVVNASIQSKNSERALEYLIDELPLMKPKTVEDIHQMYYFSMKALSIMYQICANQLCPVDTVRYYLRRLKIYDTIKLLNQMTFFQKSFSLELITHLLARSRYIDKKKWQEISSSNFMGKIKYIERNKKIVVDFNHFDAYYDKLSIACILNCILWFDTTVSSDQTINIHCKPNIFKFINKKIFKDVQPIRTSPGYYVYSVKDLSSLQLMKSKEPERNQFRIGRDQFLYCIPGEWKF